MSEHFPTRPDVDLPVAEDVPLAYLEQGEEFPRALYTFDTPDLQDKYVVREMVFDDRHAVEKLPLGEQYATYEEEIRRLSAAGVRVPQTYTVQPEGIEDIVHTGEKGYERKDVMVVAEKIDPVATATADPELIRTQAQEYVDGLAGYLEDSYDSMRAGNTPYYLGDVFKPTEVMYGQPHGGGEAGFFMVDTGGLMHRTDVEDIEYDRDRANIMATGLQLSRMVNDSSIEAYAMNRLGMTEEQADAALHMYYSDTNNPDFEDYA